MHGRLKVRTSEEEKQRKQKENVLKVKAYKAAMTKIQAKRSKQELDDEMLVLTAQILLRNPDVLTLWNIRRECVLSKEVQEKEAADQMYDAELTLTEQCLLVNPKSYGAWHHRCWTLEQNPTPNWEREIQLCNKYLKLDERNFHTWNYRQYVVDKAKVEKQKELEFCTEKIQANFSNYSSWHYRSNLLPILYPAEGMENPKRPINETVLKDELEMVLTAAFTDPNDSSAWFYQRWLLGNSRPNLEICAVRMNASKAVIAFTSPITLDEKSTKLIVHNLNADKQFILTNWLPVNSTCTSNVWAAKLSSETEIDSNANYEIEVNISNLIKKRLELRKFNSDLYYFKPPSHSDGFSKEVLTELTSQLESCNSLLEYEPESKWTLLTSALLMRAIDSDLYHEKTLDHLQKLQKVDFLREGYYKDLGSKWVLEKVLKDWIHSDQFPKSLSLMELPNLTSLKYSQYMIIADEILMPMNSQNIKTFTNILNE